MGNTDNSRLQGRISEECRECTYQWTSGANGPFAPEQRWPALPGQPQYDWEEPRVESRVGCTINGYNFREDLLRMEGNAVVEQTSQLAWVTLWNNILK